MAEPSSTDPKPSEVRPGTGEGKQVEPVEVKPVPSLGLGEIVSQFFGLAGHPEAGRKVDRLLDIWERSNKASAIATAVESISRTVLSMVAIGAVVYLSLNKIIAGEAVAAILSGFVGYLWGEKHGKKQAGKE